VGAWLLVIVGSNMHGYVARERNWRNAVEPSQFLLWGAGNKSDTARVHELVTKITHDAQDGRDAEGLSGRFYSLLSHQCGSNLGTGVAHFHVGTGLLGSAASRQEGWIKRRLSA
jgi:hypothetical protein